MNTIIRTHKTVLIAAALALGLSATADARDNRGEIRYSVTVTNSTKAIQFTPIIAATHNHAIALFELGQPATAPLADVAESGDTAALATLLEGSSSVSDVASTAGLLDAGASATFIITTTPHNVLFSMVAMLLPTNDAFIALDSVHLPRKGSHTYYAHAYDAGSEPNDELCANIPGPFCGGEGRSPDDTNAEGFVHMANGVHGIADVPAQSFDWRGAVAEVTITRMR